jgi:hypothetical protein
MGKFVPFGKKEEKGKEKAPAKGGKPNPFEKKAGAKPAPAKDMKKKC